MRALIRNPGETVRESDGILGIDWTTGAPLTNAAWCGGPYKLVLDYKEPESSEEYPEAIPEVVPENVPEVVPENVPEVAPETTPEDVPKTRTFVINGVEYTEQELKNLLIAE